MFKNAFVMRLMLSTNNVKMAHQAEVHDNVPAKVLFVST